MATSGRPLSEHERQRICRLLALGKSISEVADLERLSRAAVRRIREKCLDKIPANTE